MPLERPDGLLVLPIFAPSGLPGVQRPDSSMADPTMMKKDAAPGYPMSILYCSNDQTFAFNRRS